MSGDLRERIPWNGLTLLKALAAVEVVIVHAPVYRQIAAYCNPFNVAVVIFLFVQAFIVFARLSGGRAAGSYYRPEALARMALRVIVPWTVAVLLFAVLGFRHGHSTEYFWNCGAFGPGSYYLMLYLLSYFTLPLIWTALKRCGRWGIPVGLAFALVLEFLYPLMLGGLRNPALVYRCTPVRYLGVFALAFAAVELQCRALSRRVVWTVAGLGVASLALAYVRSLAPDRALSMPEDFGWWICHLPYYLFPCAAAFLLLRAERFLSRTPCWILAIGRWSWYVFLAQMVVYAVLAR